MKRYFLTLLLGTTFSVHAQQKIDTLLVEPKWSISVDLLNFQDNYPALLIAGEYQLPSDLAFQLEMGPVFMAEAYEQTDFEKYLGFKSRIEGRFYFEKSSNRRVFVGVDFAYQQDQYILDYLIDFNNFGQFVEGKFTRNVLGTHIRFGSQRFFSDKLYISASIGLGRQFIYLDAPDQYNSSEANLITDTPALDPISMNIRMKVGFILSKLVNK
jgi:hypothetical protein